MTSLQFFILSCIIFLYMTCGSNIPFGNEVYLLRPIDIRVEAIPQQRFKFSYFIQNEERSFNGYNLYISRTSISDGEIYSSLTPLSRDGGLPTFRHHPKEFNLDQLQSVILDRYIDTISKFEVKTQYYFKMTAHSRTTANGIESQPSNEVTAIAIP